MPSIKLTQDLITKGFQCPPHARRIEICDAELPGLYLEVRSTSPGQGTYYLRYKSAGKTCHQKLGRTTDISLAEARSKARTRKAQISLGADPRAEERARLAAITLGALFDDHYLPYVKDRKRSWRRDVELFRRARGTFGSRRINEITRQQIQTFHASVLSEGLSPASADHHLKLVRQMLNLAVEWEMLEKNPAAGVRQFNVDNRVEHYLNDEQLERLLTVLRTHPNRIVCSIAIFLLSTGSRLNEALKATSSQIDRDNRVWRIPATNSKSKKVRSVPLNDTALNIISQLETEGAFEHLFVNRQTGRPYRTIMKVWSRIRKQAGVPFLRIHDLGIPVGKTVARIRVPVVYRYHVELAPEWKVLLKDKAFIVISPSVKPSLPVAIDTGRLESQSSGPWAPFTGNSRVADLQKSITKTLTAKADHPAYIQLQREVARQAVKEFVAKWLITQERWKSASSYPIHVFFADEPIQSLKSVPQPFVAL